MIGASTRAARAGIGVALALVAWLGVARAWRLPPFGVRIAERTPITGERARQPAGERVADAVKRAAPMASESRAENAGRAALWSCLRPASETLVPDPDGVGPCAPITEGGHSAVVVRRYRDLSTGSLVWEHEDGGMTRLDFDDRLGRGHYIVTRLVPTRARPLKGVSGRE